VDASASTDIHPPRAVVSVELIRPQAMRMLTAWNAHEDELEDRARTELPLAFERHRSSTPRTARRGEYVDKIGQHTHRQTVRLAVTS